MAKLLDHQEIDGIQEYDNPIPAWLLALFASTVIFGIGYAIYYPSLPNYPGLSGWTSSGQYLQQRAVEDARFAPLRAAAEQKALAALASLASDQATVSKGREIFAARCSPCHGEKAEGRVGPNLTDNAWVYGGEAKDILQSIREGRPKGMPKWKTDLEPDEIQNVAAFVISLSAGKEQDESTGKEQNDQAGNEQEESAVNQQEESTGKEQAQ